MPGHRSNRRGFLSDAYARWTSPRRAPARRRRLPRSPSAMAAADPVPTDARERRDVVVPVP
ncbi:hypothetical protein GUG46_15600, partial [Xanthomonas citri pv. citri]|nr:hypothetical protein [Xanthomonas citri pv. citri]